MPDATQSAARDEVRALYPWVNQLGLVDLVGELILDDASAYQIVAEVRNTDQYRQAFPGMTGPDGKRRYASEGSYLAAVESYRDVLMEAGWYDPATDSPQDYAAFMDAGIDPNELRDRKNIYQVLQRGTDELRDAFYVYAGMDVSVDDLFQATVSPEFGTALVDEYNRTVAGATLDYDTYISRATERGLSKVSDLLGDLQDANVLTGDAVAQIRSVDPEFAREIMGAIANTGDKTLNLDELSYAFQYAMLGSAATEAGLTTPTADMVEALRTAGVTKAQATKTYQEFASRRFGLEGMVERLGIGSSIDQETFARADLLGSGPGVDLIARAEALENALGRSSGSFGAAREGSRLAQRGRRAPLVG